MKTTILLFLALVSCLAADHGTITIFADPELHMSGHAWVRIDLSKGETICCGMQIKGLIKEPLEVPETSTSFTLPVSEAQINKIGALVKNPGAYEPFQNNCIDFVVKILDIIEVEHPSFRQWNLSQPGLFYDWTLSKRQSLSELAPFK